jgi:hypothetical protein
VHIEASTPQAALAEAIAALDDWAPGRRQLWVLCCYAFGQST